MYTMYTHTFRIVVNNICVSIAKGFIVRYTFSFSSGYSTYWEVLWLHILYAEHWCNWKVQTICTKFVIFQFSIVIEFFSRVFTFLFSTFHTDREFRWIDAFLAKQFVDSNWTIAVESVKFSALKEQVYTENGHWSF